MFRFRAGERRGADAEREEHDQTPRHAFTRRPPPRPPCAGTSEGPCTPCWPPTPWAPRSASRSRTRTGTARTARPGRRTPRRPCCAATLLGRTTTRPTGTRPLLFFGVCEFFVVWLCWGGREGGGVSGGRALQRGRVLRARSTDVDGDDRFASARARRRPRAGADDARANPPSALRGVGQAGRSAAALDHARGACCGDGSRRAGRAARARARGWKNNPLVRPPAVVKHTLLVPLKTWCPEGR